MTGIFSGSFNPIHIGHLALANWLCEYEGLDELWFVVSPRNPLKQQSELMDDQQRLAWVEAAIKDYPRFRASSVEFDLPKPSYTIDTLRHLERQHPDRTFAFILGADNWNGIHQWKEYQTLITRYPLLIYPRKGYDIHIPPDLPNVRTVPAPLLDISSSAIRRAIAEGRSLPFFLPEPLRSAVACGGWWYRSHPPSAEGDTIHD